MIKKLLTYLMLSAFIMLFAVQLHAQEADLYTKLLIQSDTFDGDATFTDSSLSNHSIEVLGDAHHSADEAVYGNTSVYFDGALGNVLRISDHSDFELNGDFTVDCWVMWTELTDSYQFVAGDYINHGSDGADHGWVLGKTPDNKISFWDEWSHIYNASQTTMELNIWYHVAVVRSGASMLLFVNGVLENTWTSSGILDAPTDFFIGSYKDTDGRAHIGYVDAFRLSKGIARWTEDFNPGDIDLTPNLLRITPSTATVNAGSSFALSVNVQNATDVYGIQSTFIIDRPEFVTLDSVTYGDFFDPGSRLEIPDESDALASASADRFSVAISHRNPALPVAGSGTLAGMSYTVSEDAYGEIVIAADNVVFSDQYGAALDSAYEGAVVTVEHPVLVPGGGEINGSVVMPPGIDPAGTVITLANENGDFVTVTVNEDGTFSVTDLKDGTYRVWADNAPYFSGCTEIVIIDRQIVNTDPLTLLNGDVNGDGNIDIGDVTLVANYFSMSTSDIPEEERRVDLNSDGTVNVQDLAIVGANFGMERCQ